jgi:hypothetical protein
LSLETDKRLFKVDVIIEDDYFRVTNIKRKIYTGDGSIIFFDFDLWKSYFYKIYCDYYQNRRDEPVDKEDYTILLESFYFHYNLFDSNMIRLKRAIKSYVRECRNGQVCNFKF